MYCLPDTCILCLQKNIKVQSVLIQDTDGIVVNEKIKYFFPEIIECTPDAHKVACSECLEKLRISYDFKQLVIRNSTVFRDYIEKLQRQHTCQQLASSKQGTNLPITRDFTATKVENRDEKDYRNSLKIENFNLTSTNKGQLSTYACQRNTNDNELFTKFSCQAKEINIKTENIEIIDTSSEIDEIYIKQEPIIEDNYATNYLDEDLKEYKDNICRIRQAEAVAITELPDSSAQKVSALEKRRKNAVRMRESRKREAEAVANANFPDSAAQKASALEKRRKNAERMRESRRREAEAVANTELSDFVAQKASALENRLKDAERKRESRKRESEAVANTELPDSAAQKASALKNRLKDAKRKRESRKRIAEAVANTEIPNSAEQKAAALEKRRKDAERKRESRKRIAEAVAKTRPPDSTAQEENRIPDVQKQYRAAYMREYRKRKREALEKRRKNGERMRESKKREAEVVANTKLFDSAAQKLEEDAANWLFYKTMSSNLQMNREVVPHININQEFISDLYTSQLSLDEQKRRQLNQVNFKKSSFDETSSDEDNITELNVEEKNHNFEFVELPDSNTLNNIKLINIENIKTEPEENSFQELNIKSEITIDEMSNCQTIAPSEKGSMLKSLLQCSSSVESSEYCDGNVPKIKLEVSEQNLGKQIPWSTYQTHI